ncbi:MAG: hypothetical protein JWO85_2263 [Candidatus Eremiobacteraeota bacterium]|jgi:hypothetical protein|nr:hypothetical protein [Candidatus Eremiobacteraeota bacterium]
MKSPLAALLVGAALLAIPGAALAQPSTEPAPAAGPATAPAAAPAMAPSAMAPMKPPSNGATMLCRPATQGEKPTAMMGSTGIVCKTMDKMMQNGMMMVPNTKSAADGAWQGWLTQALLVPVTAPGNG